MTFEDELRAAFCDPPVLRGTGGGDWPGGSLAGAVGARRAEVLRALARRPGHGTWPPANSLRRAPVPSAPRAQAGDGSGSRPGSMARTSVLSTAVLSAAVLLMPVLFMAGRWGSGPSGRPR